MPRQIAWQSVEGENHRMTLLFPRGWLYPRVSILQGSNVAAHYARLVVVAGPAARVVLTAYIAYEGHSTDLRSGCAPLEASWLVTLSRPL